MLLAVTISTTAQAQTWIPFAKTQPTPTKLNINANNNQTLSFEIEIGGMYVTEINENGVTYSRLAIDGAWAENTPIGSPELPTLKYNVAIPQCDEVILTYTTLEQRIFNGYTVYPAPKHVAVEEQGSELIVEQFAYDTTAYRTDTCYNSLVSKTRDYGYFREQKYVEILVNPVSYNPVSKQLKVNERIIVTLEFINPISDINVNTGIFNSVAANAFINYHSNGINAAINDRASVTGTVRYINLEDTTQAGEINADYLIITDDMFLYPPDSNLTRIAQHRATYNGFNVAIVDVESVINIFHDIQDDKIHASPRAIRRFIKRVYEGKNALHTLDGHLGYVLLVGDVYDNNTGMPMSQDHNQIDPLNFIPFPSDYYYSCLTQGSDNEYDDIGDLFIGRFSVRNSKHLFNMVGKTIAYETEYTFGNWRKTIGFTNDIIAPPEYWQNYYSNILSKIDDVELKVANRCIVGDSVGAKTYEYMNEGVFYQQYNGHGFATSWTDSNIDITAFKNNLNNSHKTPFINTVSCSTGWFDTTECIGEFLVRDSIFCGAVGYVGSSRANLGGWSDYNHSSYQDLYYRSIFEKKMSIAGEFILSSKTTPHPRDYQNKYCYNLLGDPALNIMAVGYRITKDTKVDSGTWNLSTDLTVCSGVNLTLSGCTINFEDKGCIIVKEGATLKSTETLRINGFNLSNFIRINGKLCVEDSVYFTSKNRDRYWQGLILNNPNVDFAFQNMIFNKCNFQGNTKSLSLSKCKFNDAIVGIESQILTLNKSKFDNSPILTTHLSGNKSSKVNIIGCQFKITDGAKSAVNIESYSNFNIKQNTITGNQSTGDGVSISNSGWGAISHNISNNKISGFNYGIKLYRSKADINGFPEQDGQGINYEQNIITNNNYGLGCFNGSATKLCGNSDAEYESETQRIFNNHINQVLVTDNSFPTQFRFNAIYGYNPYSVYYLGFIVPGSNSTPPFIVSKNYWGTNFNPQTAFFPHSAFNYEPTWEIIPIKDNKAEVEIMYAEAETLLKNGNYEASQNVFTNIVALFPDNQLALESLKQLMVISNITSRNYAELREYYQQVAIDNSNENEGEKAITKLSHDLANYCLILDKNYEPAIAYLNNKINSDDNTERVFAAIDLEYIDQLIENDNKNKSNENHTDLINYIEYKDDMLRKLSGRTNNTQDNIQAKIGTDNIIISPNPAREILKVRFSTILEMADIKIKIFDIFGNEYVYKQIKEVESGTHYITINTDKLNSGVYIISLYINDIASCSQKLLISK